MTIIDRSLLFTSSSFVLLNTQIEESFQHHSFFIQNRLIIVIITAIKIICTIESWFKCRTKGDKNQFMNSKDDCLWARCLVVGHLRDLTLLSISYLFQTKWNSYLENSNWIDTNLKHRFLFNYSEITTHCASLERFAFRTNRMTTQKFKWIAHLSKGEKLSGVTVFDLKHRFTLWLLLRLSALSY